MHKITIFGISDKINDIKNTDATVILRTKVCDAADILKSNGVDFITLDDVYDKAQDFDVLDKMLSDEVISHAQKSDVIYIVLGSAVTGDGSVSEIFDCYPNVEIIAGEAIEYDLLSKCFDANASGGYCVIPAAFLEDGIFSPRLPLIVTALDNKFLLSDVKILLSQEYGDEHSVIIGDKNGYSKVMLFELDRIKACDHNTLVFVPAKDDNARYDLFELQKVFLKLRSPQGCPWDKEQTHISLKRYLLEECAEVIDAIDSGDMFELCDELGDVLLQVLFHATIAWERGDFDMRDICDNLARKLIKRHPHVFSDANANNPDEVLKIWDEIKHIDKDDKSISAKLRDVPKAMTALMRAQKVLSRALKADFAPVDISDISLMIINIEDNVSLLKTAIDKKEDTQHEFFIGEILFNISNISQILKVESEFLLKDSTKRFIERINKLEAEK